MIAAHTVLGRSEDRVIERHACRARRHRLHRRVVGVDHIAGLAVGSIGHDARAAGLDEGLARAAQRGEHRFDRRPMVGIGGVDHRVGVGGVVGEQGAVIERADNGLDAALAQRCGALVRAGEPRHLMARALQGRGHRAADVAGRAGHEDLHGLAPLEAECEA
jgi:hypothetical protein